MKTTTDGTYIRQGLTAHVVRDDRNRGAPWSLVVAGHDDAERVFRVQLTPAACARLQGVIGAGDGQA